MKVRFIILMILMETLVAAPLMARERNMRNGHKPRKYSLNFEGSMRKHFNLPKKYTKEDLIKYYNAYSRISINEHL